MATAGAMSCTTKPLGILPMLVAMVQNLQTNIMAVIPCMFLQRFMS
eukprot:CAMPEP_0174321858 /NCGR_PEP_ID=MMETSP0810-20121108/10624_1 /TAXON_ID=73025 ORGANISM="Eutreptiella gymnastica-like, Strain CCMP1594" /NCGR_SAMPLE_ID=MMETSP0810 /ASSEMBLY_ACC=CAM_ASM_000659 /LENGTH=45 /DNA_ID= /DNA_START= /DNA_END= /DNA_ORIENTATION=